MITKDTLLGLNKKQIEALLNSKLSDFSMTSITPSEVKNGMFEHLSKHFDGLKAEILDYQNNEFVITIGRASIVVKISTKSTGEVVTVSRLRKKPLKQPGKFSLDKVIYNFNEFLFELKDETTWTVQIDSRYTTTGDKLIIEKFDIPLSEVLSPEFIINAFNEKQKENAEYPHGQVIKYTSFQDELELNVAQPILKSFFLKYHFKEGVIKKEELKMIPKSHYDSLPEEIYPQALFDLIVKIISDINSELIEEVIKKMFSEETI